MVKNFNKYQKNPFDSRVYLQNQKFSSKVMVYLQTFLFRSFSKCHTTFSMIMQDFY